MGLKNNIIKSLIYRVLTITLAFCTTFIITQDIVSAISVVGLTEFIQFINYFVFESAWNHYYERKLRKKLKDELEREINLKIGLDSIKEISYEFSQVDTFIPKVYNSVLNFFNKMLNNKDLKELYNDILEYKNCFLTINTGRNFSEMRKE